MRQSGTCTAPVGSCGEILPARGLDAGRASNWPGGTTHVDTITTIAETLVIPFSFSAVCPLTSLEPEQHFCLHRLNQIAKPGVTQALATAVQLGSHCRLVVQM